MVNTVWCVSFKTFSCAFKHIYLCAYKQLFLNKNKIRGFPDGAVVGNPPAHAEDADSIPGPGGSHMPWSNWACASRLLSLRSRDREPQLLSPCATTTEAHTPGALLRNGRGHHNEKPMHRNEEWSSLATAGEGPCAATKTQGSQK